MLFPYKRNFDMSEITLSADRRSYIPQVIRGLLCCGWTLESVPANGKIPRNGAKILLKANGFELRLRLFTYKVTGSGRGKTAERRIEITTTYGSGLTRSKAYLDIVLGVDPVSSVYVGVDPHRLALGGETHNASSFFDKEGLGVKPGQLLINPRRVVAKGFSDRIERHAFFDQSRISEYLFNHGEIHSGDYGQGGLFHEKLKMSKANLPRKISDHMATGDHFVLTSNARMSKRPLTNSMIEAVEANDFTKIKGKKITPEGLKEIQSACEAIGALGEQFVLNEERRRLRKAGHLVASLNVERVSLRSVGEGYDIASFGDNGKSRRYIEVKTTVGVGFLIDISSGEWRAAKKYREEFYLARVINMRSSPKIFYICDPYGLSEKIGIEKTATGWKIDIKSLIQ
jgi:hypothetical protein